MSDNTSTAYLAKQYQLIHKDLNRYRGRLQPYFVREIEELVKRHDAHTLLDYGSGKGCQYSVHHQHVTWGICPVCYDPGVPAFAEKPKGTFDGVICTDVAEHIPENHVRWFIRDVLSYARKFVFFCIFTDPAKATLPDGRNAHLTIQPKEWWERVILNTAQDLHPGRHAELTRLEQHTLIQTRGLEIVVVFRTRDKKHWL